MTSRILLAYPETAASEAQSVAAKLGALGYQVGPLSPRARGDKVVMLWSRAAWGTPALRAAARRAHAAGKLVCIRLDAAPPPVDGVKLARLPRGRADQGAWRRLLHPRQKAAAVEVKPAAASRVAKPQRRTRPQRAAITQAAPRPVAQRQASPALRAPNRRGVAVALTLTLVAIAAANLAYQHDAAFSARIDSAASTLYLEASKLTASVR